MNNTMSTLYGAINDLVHILSIIPIILEGESFKLRWLTGLTAYRVRFCWLG